MRCFTLDTPGNWARILIAAGRDHLVTPYAIMPGSRCEVWSRHVITPITRVYDLCMRRPSGGEFDFWGMEHDWNFAVTAT
jgi:hypothetical protein